MNIILVSLDTLTAGHLGSYGYWRNTSPNLDKFAAGATLFENCFAPGIPTQPCYTTTFSGRVPLDHGIVAHGGTFDVRPGVVFAQEILADAGYHTACVSALPKMKPWFARGWKEDIPPIVAKLMTMASGLKGLTGPERKKLVIGLLNHLIEKIDKGEDDSEFETLLKSMVPAMVDGFAGMLKLKGCMTCFK